MARKSVIEELEYHGGGDISSDFTQTGFPIRKDSIIKDVSIWQRRF